MLSAQVFLAGVFTSRGEVAALLKAAGARLLTRPPAAQEQDPSSPVARQVVVWDTDAAQAQRVLPHAPNVRLQWVLDSVSRFVVQDCDHYAVQLPA